MNRRAERCVGSVVVFGRLGGGRGRWTLVHPSYAEASSQGICVVTWPGFAIVMTPAQVHMHWNVLFRAGMPPIRTVGEPGAHGAGVTGIQGTGVRIPRAAAVAAATAGLAT